MNSMSLDAGARRAAHRGRLIHQSLPYSAIRQRRRKARWAMEVVATTATTSAHRIGRKANARRTHLPASAAGFIREKTAQKAMIPAQTTDDAARHGVARPAQQQPRGDERGGGGQPHVRVDQVPVEVRQRRVGRQVETAGVQVG